MTTWEKLNRLLVGELGQPGATRLALRLQAEMPGAVLRIPSPKREQPSKTEVLDALEQHGGDVREASLALGVKAEAVFTIANSPDRRWPALARRDDISAL